LKKNITALPSLSARRAKGRISLASDFTAQKITVADIIWRVRKDIEPKEIQTLPSLIKAFTRVVFP